MKYFLLLLLLLGTEIMSQGQSTHQDLVNFFERWRSFETPPMVDGVPDYTRQSNDARYKVFLTMKEELDAFDISGWSTAEQNDWKIILAEMNGYDFNYRVLQPWHRDPAYYATIWTYRSDVPAHEGPTHHAVVELWQYDFPLTEQSASKLATEIGIIPALFKQAQINLTGNARELWIAGIRDIRQQDRILESILARDGVKQHANLVASISGAMKATREFIDWLEIEGEKKTGPSGLGKDNYSWYQQNVHLVPMTWEDEVRLLQRELDRAWSNLKLEEHRNRKLTPLVSAESPEAYAALAEKSARYFLDFLDKEDIVTVADYFEPALREHLGEFVPKKGRNFFYIGSHFDPTPLFSHFYHWFELARMDLEPHPSPIRQGALLYNIFDSRNEGVATGVEEIFMHAGLYDHNPRVREIVWIMLAQRAARGLGSLYAHANEMTMEEAGGIHMNWTPRGWMKTEKELLLFEQHLYLRQPGYGTSYITGKYLLENLMAEYAKKAEDSGKPFELKTFFDTLNRIDCIPMELAKIEMLASLDN
jgi:hypothetical protein